MPKKMGEMAEETGNMKSRALQILNDTDFEEIYRSIDVEGDKAIDAAVKMILADKLVESINKAKRYAKENKKKRLNASTILIAAQEKD